MTDANKINIVNIGANERDAYYKKIRDSYKRKNRFWLSCIHIGCILSGTFFVMYLLSHTKELDIVCFVMIGEGLVSILIAIINICVNKHKIKSNINK